MKKGQILIINEKEAKTLLTMEQAIDLMEKAFIEFADGKVENPVKLNLSLRPEVPGYINSMPSFMKESNIVGVKLVGTFKDNGKYGLPATTGVVVLFEPQTGIPYCIVDGTFVTNIRTGAIAGVEAKYLAKKSSRVLTVIGAGAQGYTGMLAIKLALPGIKEVRLVDLSQASVEKFMDKGKGDFPDIKFTSFSDIQSAAFGSDIIVSSATASKPLLEGIKFDPGTLAISISELLQNADWLNSTFNTSVCDFPACLIHRINQENEWAAKLNNEPFVPLPSELFDELLGDVITGRSNGRKNDEQVIFSVSVGMSMQDTICAETIYRTAVEKNLGTVVDFMDI